MVSDPGARIYIKCEGPDCPPGTDLYLYKLAPSVGPNIFSTKEADGRFNRMSRSGRCRRLRGDPSLTKEQIEGHVSALKSLIKSHNRKNKGDPIRLDFETVEAEIQGHTVVKGKEFAGPEYKMPNNIKLYDGTTDPEDHLSCFAGAANSGEWSMPVWCRMFQQTLDGSARGWFERLPHDSINEWAELREAFAARFSVRRACFKEPHEITKITRKANESLTPLKEKWTVETGFIMGVSKVMKISSFMDSVKSHELAKRFLDKVPATVNKMMERLDDFVRSKESYASTELPKGEIGEDEFRNNYRGRDAYRANKARDDRAPYPPPRGEYNRRVTPVLTLNCLTKHPKEILAIETQLRLPVPRPMLNPLRSRNADRYCDYNQKKGHCTNDCMQLRKKLEMALESRKLNHLMKDVRQRGRGSHTRDDPQQTKIINVARINSVKDKKRKISETTESWMNVPISFPAISSKDVFEEPLIVEAEVEGIKDRLRETQTDLVRFAEEVSKPLWKIELEVRFGNGGLCRRTSMKFIVFRAPSPYNIILRRPGLKAIRAIPSTIHLMMKFPTPKGVATLVAEWAKAGIVRPVKYPTYISNPVVVKKGDGAWRMCIDFKNLNSACPKDYYPLPNIDCATYQRLVDSAFQSQIGRNLEAYVDDMVIKSRNEKMLLADIAETFDILKKINMKLNPKKCSFGVEERKFLGYVVTSEGVIANPKKTKAMADLQNPRTLKEMQSLNGKLASLSRFLAKSSKRSLPFLNTLKNITKENKHEY
uniref:Reverse transcriptase domain-containing protein n=1 Tax=Tanacetum cinerariifolium TaxID=118510 RepID=A0A699GYL5_TANCI|nr:hypothetical protein [Tanacetum cinerariifolium]